MATIPNTEYVTVSKEGIFVGGKPAIYYCGQKILYPETIMDNLKRYKANIQISKNFVFWHLKPGLNIMKAEALLQNTVPMDGLVLNLLTVLYLHGCW